MNNETAMVKKEGKITVRYMSTVGILTAISAVVMLFEFPLWFAPEFYKLDFSEVIVAIGAFTLGPVAGIIIELLKNILNLLLNGTTTAGVGEFANFVLGCAFIVPASLIYKYSRTLKGALIGLIVGTVSLALIGALMNMYVLLPLYSYFYKAPIEAFVEAGKAVNRNIVDLKTLIVFAVIPFNLLKALVVSVITLFSYKKLSTIIHK